MQININTETEFLAAIIQGKSEISSDLLANVEPGHFSVESYQWVVKQLKGRSWTPIQYQFLDQLLDEAIKDEEKKALFKMQLYQVYARDLTFVEDSVAKFKTFISYSIVKATTKQAFDNFDRTGRVDYMLKDLGEAQRKASTVVGEGSYKHSDWASGYKGRQEKRLLERDNPAIRPVIKMGIKGLDTQFQIRAPMVINFLAPFKRYKSIVLNHASFVALLQGFNVAQIVYENTIELTEDRLDSLATGLSYDRLLSMALTPDEKKRAEDLFKWTSSWSSRLKILKCQPMVTTMLDVEEQLERWNIQENFKPDVIVIDYYNIIAPIKKFGGEERLEQGSIIWDIKNLADKLFVPVITASQSNTEGAVAERLEMDHQGKSIGISQGVDMTVAINQTKEEREEGLLVFSPLFMRGFPITIPEVVTDCDLNRMSICKDISELWQLAAKNFPYTP